MSYQSKPVPGGEPSPGERLFRVDEARDTQQVEQDEPVTGPPPSPLRRLLEHEDTRSAALRGGTNRAARRGFATVVADLDELLDTAKAQLRLLTGHDQATVRDGAGSTDTLAAIPLRDVAELLDLPRTTVDTVLARLRETGGLGGEDRRPVLRALDELRLELRITTDDEDHSLLDRLVRVIVMLSGLVATAVAAASWAPPDEDDRAAGAVVAAALAALTALTLERTTELVREPHRARDPLAETRAAHEALLHDLTAHPGGPTTTRAAVLVRVVTARIALIPLEWTEKHAYWDLLDRIATATEHGRSADVTGLRGELAALPPPAED